jgi:SAM-dependent methyltransferase
MSAEGASTFRAPAEAYDRHIGRYAGDLARGLAGLAGVRAGARALDVGCGPGALTRVLAEALGPAAVAAVDPSPQFAAACRERVPGADVREGAAEALPFADATFDAVLSQLVLNFMSDAPAGAREMRRVARPGAVVVAAVWDYAGGMTLLRRFWDAVERVDPAAAAARDEGRVMRHCTPVELDRLWRGAGLADVACGELTCSVRYANFDDLWAPFEGGVGPSGAYAAALAEQPRKRLREAFRELLGAPAAGFMLAARAWTVRGTVPL